MDRGLIRFGFTKNIRSLFSVVNGILLSIVLVNNFSADVASEWFFIANLVALFMLSDLSLPSSLARINSAAIASGKISIANDYAAVAATLLLAVAALVGLILWITYHRIGSDLTHLSELLTYVFLIITLQVPLKIFDGILISKLYLNRQITCDLTGSCIKLCTLIYFFTSSSQDIQSLGLLYYGAQLSVAILKVLASGHLFDLRLKLNFSMLKKLADFSLAAFTMSAANLLTRQGFLIISFYFISPEEYVVVNLIYLFYFNMYQVQTTFLSAIGPIIAATHAKLGDAKVLESTSRFLRYTKNISVGMLVLLIILFYPIALQLYPSQSHNILDITIILLFGNVIFLVTYPSLIYRSALNYLSMHWLVSKKELSINSVTLLLSIGMLYLFQINALIITAFCLTNPMLLRSFAGYQTYFSHSIRGH